MTYQEFDTLFGFDQEGHVQTPPHWFGHSFWNEIKSSQALSFFASHNKSSHIKSKALWYLHRFISYSINARAMSNEVVSLDYLFILNCLIKNEKIALGRFLQWRIQLISDSLVGAICIGGVVTKLAKFFRIDLHNLVSIKPMFLNESFIKNSKQFTSLNKKWVQKHDLGDRENVEALFQEIEEYQGEKEQQQEEQVEPPPIKKRTRSEETSQQGPQAFNSEPPWVG